METLGKINPFVIWFGSEYGTIHADDISGTVLSAVEAKVKNEYFDIGKHVQNYLHHWKQLGVNPMSSD